MVAAPVGSVGRRVGGRRVRRGEGVGRGVEKAVAGVGVRAPAPEEAAAAAAEEGDEEGAAVAAE